MTNQRELLEELVRTLDESDVAEVLDLVYRKAIRDDHPHVTDVEYELLARDGWACANCFAGCHAMQIDHVHPRRLGGCDHIDNLQWLCPHCNAAKGATPPDEWERSGGAAKARDRSPCANGCVHDRSIRDQRLFPKAVR